MEDNKEKLMIIREFNAPKSLVFEVLTKEEHLKNWHAPGSMEVIEADCDFKEGGRYSITIGSDKFKYTLGGTYKKIEAPNKITYTQNTPNITYDTQINISLSENKGVTTMKFIHAGFPSSQDRDNSLKGWTAAIEQIPQLLAELLEKKS